MAFLRPSLPMKVAPLCPDIPDLVLDRHVPELQLRHVRPRFALPPGTTRPFHRQARAPRLHSKDSL